MKKSIFFAALLAGTCATAQAEFVNATTDDGLDVSYDTQSKLLWLDLTHTFDKAARTAESEFSSAGFRLASNSEVENMFTDIFATSNPYVDKKSYEAPPENYAREALEYQSLFGTTGSGHFYSFGLYQDESNTWRQAGTRMGDGAFVPGWEWVFNGLENTTNTGRFESITGSSAYGTFLVRETTVSEQREFETSNISDVSAPFALGSLSMLLLGARRRG